MAEVVKAKAGMLFILTEYGLEHKDVRAVFNKNPKGVSQVPKSWKENRYVLEVPAEWREAD